MAGWMKIEIHILPSFKNDLVAVVHRQIQGKIRVRKVYEVAQLQ